MKRPAQLIMLTMLMYRSLTLGAQTPTGRWEVLIRGPATTGQSAEIRFERGGARILLETDDSAFLPVSQLRVANGQISFKVPGLGLSFSGEVHDTSMSGQLASGDGPPLDWSAWPLPASLEKWPIRPRLVVTQLLLGREHTTVTIPGTWVAALPARATLGTEYQRRLLRLPAPVPKFEQLPSPDIMALGFDPTMRAAAHRLLETIGDGPAGGARFVELFGKRGQRWLDIHDRALDAARSTFNGWQLRDAARGINALGISVNVADDSLSILSAAWRLWNQLQSEPLDHSSDLEHLRNTDLPAANALLALLNGYDIARRWWLEAVTWLLDANWMESAAGPRSPVRLIEGFWGRDSIQRPVILTTQYGGYEAHAINGIGALGSRIVKPGNAIAAEWLAKHGSATGLLAWRRVGPVRDTLAVDFGGIKRNLGSPLGWAQGHYGNFLPGQDLVVIDAGIVPIFAVATLMHEWQHLLFIGERFRIAAAHASPQGIRILDEDPWLSEGAAEWATDAILARGGRTGLLLRALEAGKRYALEQGGGDDPHATGYRLVMAVASRGVAPAVLRRRLTTYMHDPIAFAKASGFSGNRGARPLRLESPVDAVVIPETSFTWDSEFADHVQRRLIVPHLRPEH